MFVATKKQAKEIVSELASKMGMPYITERWPGGMLTNFVTIRKAVKKMSAIDRMKTDARSTRCPNAKNSRSNVRVKTWKRTWVPSPT